MAAPSVISVTATAYNSNTTPKSTGAIAVQAGDVLIAIGLMEHDRTNAQLTISTTAGTDPTWVRREEYRPDSVDLPYATLFSGVAVASENVTFSIARSADSAWFGGEVHVWRGSDGLGDTNVANNADGSGAPSVVITTTQANSGISAGGADWNAAGAATWTTTAGAVVERTDFTDGAHYSAHTATYADVGVIGAKTVGMSAPATQRYGIVAAEIKGTAAAGGGLKSRKTLLGVGL